MRACGILMPSSVDGDMSREVLEGISGGGSNRGSV